MLRKKEENDLKENLNLTFQEAKNYYKLHLSQFDDIIRKNNSLILTNTILISLIIANPYLIKIIINSNYIIVLTFIIGISILFASLFFSLLSIDKNVLKLPKIESIYSLSLIHSNLNLINALTKEYIKDINYNSNKFNKKSKILNSSVLLLKIGLIFIFIDILFIIVNNIG
ncbi:hypothetical protein HOK76_06665 [archaeon]|jgi:hypothetical protein|nr:hypothetical protein [archaeon]